MILSDHVWVSLQRTRGNSVTMVPHSLAAAALVVEPAKAEHGHCKAAKGVNV